MKRSLFVSAIPEHFPSQVAGGIKNIGIVSVATGLSRVLGLARDVLFFTCLGTGVWASAFILAFTLPNLFRRLLGEGALTSALIPVFSKTRETAGDEIAFHFFNRVLVKLAGVLLVLSLVVGGLIAALPRIAPGLESRWLEASALAAVLFPYVILICLAAIIAAAANVYSRFAAAALSPVWLNLCMIAALLGGSALYPGQPASVVWVLVGGVLAGGALQLLLPAMDLKKAGWRFLPGHPVSGAVAERCRDAERELWKMLIPGLLGAAILQVNILVSRFLAFSLDEQAASILYLGSRLMELPLGLFTVAVATVTFPALARSVAAADRPEFARAYLQGQRLVLAISLAAGVGLALLGREILTTLFGYGKFDDAAVAATYPVLAVYGLGLATYSFATLATRALHAHRQMGLVVKISAVCLVANVILSLLFMRPLGATGLACANVGAAFLQCLLLHRCLRRVATGTDFLHLLRPLAKIVAASAMIGVTCALGRMLLAGMGLSSEPLLLVICIPAGIAVFGLCLWATRFEDVDWLRKRLIQRRSHP